jgi:hypothetical protein
MLTASLEYNLEGTSVPFFFCAIDTSYVSSLACARARVLFYLGLAGALEDEILRSFFDIED